VAITPNLEEAFLDKEAKDEKPYEAIVKLSSTDSAFKSIQTLLEGLIDHSKPLPPGAIEWNNLAALKAVVEQLPSSTSS
jgi:putative ATP-dependent endonuclease of OLD family